jgi:hypothetical protein
MLAAGGVAVDLTNRLVRYRTDIAPHQSPGTGRAWSAQGNYMRKANYNQEGRVRLRSLHLATGFQLLGVGTLVIGLVLGAMDEAFDDWLTASGSVLVGLTGYLLAMLMVTTVIYSAFGGLFGRPFLGHDSSGMRAWWILPSLCVEGVLLALIVGSVLD